MRYTFCFLFLHPPQVTEHALFQMVTGKRLLVFAIIACSVPLR